MERVAEAVGWRTRRSDWPLRDLYAPQSAPGEGRLLPRHRNGSFFCRPVRGRRGILASITQEGPAWVPTHRFLASCYAHLGQFDEARETVTRLRTLTTEVVPSATHWRNPEYRELYLSGLRLAAGEVTPARPGVVPRSSLSIGNKNLN